MRLICLLLIGTWGLGQDLPSQPGFQVHDNLTLGGWFDLIISDSEGGPSDQRIPHAFVYLDADFTSGFRAFLEYASTDIQGQPEETQLQRAYLEFKHSTRAKWRLGQFNTPSGLWKEKHWYTMVDSNRKPAIADFRTIPMEALGLEFSGTRTTAAIEWDYSLFIARSQDKELNSDLGYGADLSFSIRDRFRFGSFTYQFMNSDESTDPLPGERRALLLYTESWLIDKQLMFRAEYLHMDRDTLEPTNGAYAKIKWQINKKTFLNYRFDESDDTRTGQPQLWQGQALTAGYWFNPRVRARLELGQTRHKGSNWRSEWSAWVGFIL